ncbi:MAG: family oxidoreductase [Bacteroidota bacterium]|nr:family oxidoreductase [Bacteroidota bacterium]
MNNEYAIVTGASSGMGLEFAKLLAKRGYNLVLVARRTDRLERLKKEILESHQTDIHVLSLDLVEMDSTDKLLAFVQVNKLNVTILINNAGFGTSGDFLSLPIEKTMEMLQLNIGTLTKLTYLFGNEMKKNKLGYILQVSSVGAFQPSPYFAAYSATKAYVMLFSEALDFELKGSNVSVTTLYPGATKTEFFEVSETKVNKLVARTLMTADEVADIALNAMFKRKRSIVPGIINKLSVFFAQMSPRKMTTWSAANIMK